MRFICPLTPPEYLLSLKRQMDGYFDFGAERFTGFFIGRFFYITHHAGHEWNRRITNQKNAAAGYVKKCEDGSDVRFVLFRGALCPLQLLPLLILAVIVSVIVSPPEENHTNLYINTSGVSTGVDPAILCINIVAVLIYSLIYTFFEILTERSEEGRQALISLLADPPEPYF